MIVGHLRTKHSANLVLLHDLLETCDELGRIGRKRILKELSWNPQFINAQQIAYFVASGPHRERNGIASGQPRKHQGGSRAITIVCASGTGLKLGESGAQRNQHSTE